MPDEPISAARLAEVLGDRLPRAEDLAPEAFELVARARQLVDAVVLTEVAAEERVAVARELVALAERLGVRRREDHLLLVRHADGRVESLAQAGSGRLNPHAPPVQYDHFPPPPPARAERCPLELVGRVTLTAAHGGSPRRAHGGVVAALLDEVLGVAAMAAGASGMTVRLEVQFRGATPIGVPLEIVGRYERTEGRKSYATGEIRVDGVVTAEASALYVGERPTGERPVGR